MTKKKPKKLITFHHYKTGKDVCLSPSLTVVSIEEIEETPGFGGNRTRIQFAAGGSFNVKESAKTVRERFGI